MDNIKTHVTFTFGRFNPPNKGHSVLFDTVIENSKTEKGDYKIFTSKSEDAKRNPLSYKLKLKWLYKIHPNLIGDVIEDEDVRTYLEAATFLYNMGYTNVTFVAGNEDLTYMKPALIEYNNKENKHGFYNFNTIDFVESNSPDERSTDARKYAIEYDLNKFQKVVGIDNTEIALQLLYDVRNGMFTKTQEECKQ